MFYRLFILCCFNLFLIGSVSSQQSNQVIIVVKQNGSDHRYGLCPSYDENLKELRVIGPTSGSIFGFVFTIHNPQNETEIDSMWFVPIQHGENEHNNSQNINVVINLVSDIDLPDNIYDVHVINDINEISEIEDVLTDQTIEFRLNKGIE